MLPVRLLAATLTGLATVAHGQAPSTRAPVPGAPVGVTAFVNVAVIPMDTQRVLPGHTVLVEGGRVTAVGPSSKVTVPAGATRIDGQGKYLMPGLSECHAHFTPIGIVDSASWERRLFMYAINGITTIRSADRGDPPNKQMRDLAAEGKIFSPRVYISGRASWPTTSDMNTPEALKKARLDSIAPYMAALKAAGYDFVKAYEEQGVLYDSILVVGRRVGLPIMGHMPLHGTATLKQALRRGQALIDHLTGYTHALHTGPKPSPDMKPELLTHPDSLAAQRQRIDFAQIPALAAATKRAGTWNCATQLPFEWMSLELSRDTFRFQPEVEYVPPAKREAWLARMRNMGGAGSDYTGLPFSERNGTLEARRRLIKALYDAGAGLLLGTDDPGQPTLPGVSAHRELQLLVKAGLTPYQALVVGTRNMGVFEQTFFKPPAEAGTVAVGKRADLVLLTKNPLEDITNTMQPAGVMIGGRWLSRAAIDQRVAAVWAASDPAAEYGWW